MKSSEEHRNLYLEVEEEVRESVGLVVSDWLAKKGEIEGDFFDPLVAIGAIGGLLLCAGDLAKGIEKLGNASFIEEFAGHQQKAFTLVCDAADEWIEETKAAILDSKEGGSS